MNQEETIPILPVPPWLEETLKSLLGHVERGSLGHAPLVYGPAGVGKHWLANTFAASLLCEQRSNAEVMACGECKSCQVFVNQTHPDFFRLEPEEGKVEIGVDQVRELIGQIALTPALGKYRVALISPAEAMNKNAANALLKTLEEPPNNVWVILVSHSPRKLLPTVLSRCQKVPVTSPDAERGQEWITKHSQAMDAQSVSLALALASGAPLLAMEHLELGRVDCAIEVLKVLEGIAGGGSVEPDLAQKWAGDARTIWISLSYWVSQLSLASQGLSVEPMVQALAHKTQGIDWSEVWGATLEATSMLDRPYRQDLLLSRWLLQFQLLTHESI